MEIIRAAAEAAPEGVDGVFTLKIVAAGKQRESVYLNTQEDYRDQRSVTIAVHPRVIPQVIAKYGSSPQEYFIGKTIKVNGRAKRTKITFYSKGIATNKYYYQTHIRLLDISQIQSVGSEA